VLLRYRYRSAASWERTKASGQCEMACQCHAALDVQTHLNEGDDHGIAVQLGLKALCRARTAPFPSKFHHAVQAYG
jgi:hypothetical protein